METFLHANFKKLERLDVPYECPCNVLTRPEIVRIGLISISGFHINIISECMFLGFSGLSKQGSLQYAHCWDRDIMGRYFWLNVAL